MISNFAGPIFHSLRFNHGWFEAVGTTHLHWSWVVESFVNISWCVRIIHGQNSSDWIWQCPWHQNKHEWRCETDVELLWKFNEFSVSQRIKLSLEYFCIKVKALLTIYKCLWPNVPDPAVWGATVAIPIPNTAYSHTAYWPVGSPHPQKLHLDHPSRQQ